MGFKGSTASSGAKKGAQKHQNEFAYVHQKQSKLTKHIKSLPVAGTCKKCTDIIAWRKQYGKYKSLTVPKKCVNCQGKKIKEAYHILCSDCAKEKNVCAKCQEHNEIINDPGDFRTEEEKNAEEMQFQNWLKNLPERKRRTVLRKIERGEEVKAGNVEDDDFDLDFGEDFSDEEEDEA